MSTTIDRSTYIGGSDVSALLGLNKYKSSWQVWLEKTGQRTIDGSIPSESAYWGVQMEPVLANEYVRLTGVHISDKSDVFVKHPVHNFMAGHIDRPIQLADSSRGAFLECKTRRYPTDDWGDHFIPWSLQKEIKQNSDGTLPYWGKKGLDRIPKDYMFQVQYYLLISGYDFCDVICLMGGNEIRIYHVKRNDQLISTFLPRLIEFWGRREAFLQSGDLSAAPPIDWEHEQTSKLIAELYPAEKKEYTLSGDQLSAHYNYQRIDVRYAEQKSILDGAKKERDKYANQIMKMAEGARVILAGDIKYVAIDTKNGGRYLRTYPN